MSRPKTPPSTPKLSYVELTQAGDEMVKLGRLIELTGASELTREDRLTFNLLLRNAHAQGIGDPATWFEIDLAEIRDTHTSNDRVMESIKRLMRVVVQIDGDASWDERGMGLTHLLGDTDFGSPKRKRGRMRYSFPPKMTRLLSGAEPYARLQMAVMFALRSKYSLTLFELVSKRFKLTKKVEEYSIKEFRDRMGVPPGKLTDWRDLRKVCIKPAVDEVNQLAPFNCIATPRKVDRRVTGVRLIWWEKTDAEKVAAQQELHRHSAGRAARREGKVEKPVDPDEIDGSLDE